MPIDHVNLNYPLNGGTMVVQFSFERSALSYAREIGLTSFTITCRGVILHRASP